MLRGRLLLAVLVAVGITLAAVAVGSTPRNDLPSRLSDQEFWQLVTDGSEPSGFFHSDNLTSNELLFQRVIPALVGRVKPGGVYLGVGPEQNFTYIAAVRPAMAIIFDIRRRNLQLQLMYKALFELAKDRADFVSLLFAKTRPKGLDAQSTAIELFSAFAASPADEDLYGRTLEAIDDRLTKAHRLPLSPEDVEGITYVYHAFYRAGFAVRYSPTYADLMTATDGNGVSRSFLASEGAFTLLKQLESKNLVIPVVGDFGGPKAIRRVGAYLKAYGATVTGFYLSNVEQYLHQEGKWTAFCKNVATLPLDQSSTFIRSSSGSYMGGRGFTSSLGWMATEVKICGNSS